MFMQVFIERVRRYQRSMVTVHLYFVGVHYLEYKYPNWLMRKLLRRDEVLAEMR